MTAQVTNNSNTSQTILSKSKILMDEELIFC